MRMTKWKELEKNVITHTPKKKKKKKKPGHGPYKQLLKKVVFGRGTHTYNEDRCKKKKGGGRGGGKGGWGGGAQKEDC